MRGVDVTVKGRIVQRAAHVVMTVGPGQAERLPRFLEHVVRGGGQGVELRGLLLSLVQRAFDLGQLRPAEDGAAGFLSGPVVALAELR